MKILFFITISFFAAAVHAESKNDLFFPADKNNLQILPQKFEYGLMDANTTRIGDILIDATRLSFQILPTNTGKFRLRFTWPAGLLVDGHLILKDNIGKAIVSEEFSPKDVKIRAINRKDQTENLRSEIAEYISAPLERSVIEDMKYIPFMTFCVFRENLGTRIFLCSKELYLSTPKNAGSKLAIKSRDIGQRTAQVEINRQKVGEQGLIFLNDAKENLIFKSFSASGTTLEIETRRRQVDFKDVTSNEDGSEIVVRMAGTDPVDKKTARQIGDKDWELRIPTNRPVLYLKGEGDIPMRQEFLVKGPLPTEKDRPRVFSHPEPQTYSSSFAIEGEFSSPTEATAEDADSRLEMTGDSRFRWSTTNLPPRQKTRRYLNLNRDNRKQVLAFDIFRGLPFEANLAASYLAPSGLVRGKLGIQWWMENFLGLESDLTHLRWGLNIERDQHLTTKDTEVKVDFTTLELLYRFSAGFHLEDSTWGLLIPVQMAATDGASANAYGLGVFTTQKFPENWASWISWYNVKLRYFLSSSGSTVKIKQAYTLDSLFYAPLATDFFATGGVGVSLYKFDPTAPKEDNQIRLDLGLAYHF